MFYFNESDIEKKLDELIASKFETEVTEFKEAKNSFSFDELGRYFSALSNEANLHNKECAWLVFGVEDKNHIIVANKADLVQERKPETFYLSTVTKEGLEELKEKIKKEAYNFSLEDTEFVTNNRQQDCLVKCRESLTQALEASKIHQLQDLISIDLKSALLYLDEITGEVITDDILNNIFDHFCIGK